MGDGWPTKGVMTCLVSHSGTAGQGESLDFFEHWPPQTYRTACMDPSSSGYTEAPKSAGL
jgi:hypothetical protein